MVSLPDLTLTIREERRNQNQMRGREQQHNSTEDDSFTPQGFQRRAS